jgi:hypothetical protein
MTIASRDDAALDGDGRRSHLHVRASFAASVEQDGTRVTVEGMQLVVDDGLQDRVVAPIRGRADRRGEAERRGAPSDLGMGRGARRNPYRDQVPATGSQIVAVQRDVDSLLGGVGGGNSE